MRSGDRPSRSGLSGAHLRRKRRCRQCPRPCAELAQRKPPDAAAVLLNYLPSAEDERIAETIQRSAAVFGRARRQARAGLRRGADGQIALSNAPPPPPPCLRLSVPTRCRACANSWNDSDPQVRQRVGLALATRGEKDAIPALIRLIEDLPLEHNGLVLELLDRLADGTPPPGMPVSDQSARHKYRQAWEAWWKEHQRQDRTESTQTSLAFAWLHAHRPCSISIPSHSSIAPRKSAGKSPMPRSRSMSNCCRAEARADRRVQCQPRQRAQPQRRDCLEEDHRRHHWRPSVCPTAIPSSPPRTS